MTDVADLEAFLKQEIKEAVGKSRRSDIDYICGLASRTVIARLQEHNLLVED